MMKFAFLIPGALFLSLFAVNAYAQATEPADGTHPPPPPPVGEPGFPAVYTQAGAPLDTSPTELRCSSSSSLFLGDAGTDNAIQYCTNPELLEIKLINMHSPRINPTGAGQGLWEDAVRRTYSFSAAGLSREELHIHLLDETRPGEGDSKSSMHSELRFFPRVSLPRTTLSADASTVSVRLATGEDVTFDVKTKEISGGVLSEAGPIDTNPDRFRRNFARLSYTGRGLMLRSDQRGESVRATPVFGAVKKATVSWGPKTCKIGNELLWDQGNREMRFRFPKDEEFYAFLRQQCRWPDLPNP